MATTVPPSLPRKNPLLRRRNGLMPADMKPRFVRETVLIPSKEGLIVDGTHQLQILKGKSARNLLPELIPLLDGTRSVQQLERALPGVAAEHVRTAIFILFTAGLIERDHWPNNPATQPNAETLGFFRRTIGFTGSNRSGQEAYEKLQASQVFVFYSGDPDQQGCMTSLLEGAGVGKLTVLPRSSLQKWSTTALEVNSLVVSMVVGEEDYEWHKELDRWCAKSQLTWLRAVIDVDGQSADLGPIFKNDENPCYECFMRMHPRPPRSEGGQPLRNGSRTADFTFWSGMVASEIIYILNHIAPPISARECVRYQFKNWTTQRLRAARLPGCPQCRPCRPLAEPTDGLPRIETAVVFEDHVGLQTTAYPDVRNQRQSTQMAMSLTQQLKRLGNCTQYSLPREVQKLDCGTLDVLRADIANPAAKATHVSELGAILQFTAGLRQSGTPMNQVKRWGATGGNLGSVEVFVAARNIEAIPPGLYFYDPREHALSALQLRRGGLGADQFIARVLGNDTPDLPDALVFFTGALHRVSRKYGAFAYRLINLDAGVALAQAHFLAKGLGLHARTLTRWPDDLVSQQLNLEHYLELPTAVLELSAASRRGGERPQEGCRPTRQRKIHLRLARDFAALSSSELVARLIDESRVLESEMSTSEAELVTTSATRSRTALTGIELPPPVQGGRLVGDVLSRRTSVRRFTPEMLSLEQLSTMLSGAYRGDSEDWSNANKDETSLKFVVFASQVEGLEPAVYEYDPTYQRLGRMAEMPDAEKMAELFVQPEFVGAPLLIWIFGDLAAACAKHGGFGHRQLMLRAGAAAHRLWLAALGMGLAGCLVGGMVPGAARRQFGYDGYRDTTLLAFAAGYGAQSMK